MAKGKNLNLTSLRVTLEGKPDREIAVQAYLFARDGKLIAAAPLSDGKIDLPVVSERLAGAQLYIGPAPRADEQPTIALMEKMHAYKPVFRYDPLKPLPDLLIPEAIWRLWCLRFCHVQGRVVRPITVGGMVENKPVCHARVHICEVDLLRLVILKLPELVIWRLRDELLHLIDERFPKPGPHGPGPDPGPERVISPIDRVIAPIERIAPTVPAALNPIANLKPMAHPVAMEMTAEPELKLVQPLAAMAPKLQPLLQTTYAPTVRKAIIDHLDIIQPFLCQFRWFWPYITRVDEIAVVYTDTDGRFEHTFLYWACGDQPDLYFWVEFCVGGAWTTVLRQAIPCHTYWNYASGTEVTIEINDSQVPYCEPPKTVDGKKVVVLSIGDGVNVNQINAGLTMGGQPFGGSLEPHVWFGTGLKEIGITKYRWSYRKLNSDMTPSADMWHVCDSPVLRHYAVILPDDTVVFKTDPMGPTGPNQLFRIQPETAPEGGVWVPAVNSRLNTASGYFLSHTLGNAATAAGYYEMKLELFDDAGTLVNPAAAGIEFLVPKATINAPFTAEVQTEAATSFMQGQSFRLVLRVDNNPCYAEILSVKVGMQSAGSCGFIDYEPGAQVQVKFKAIHPNNFATFGFLMTRGTFGTVESAGGAVDDMAVQAYDHDGDPIHLYNLVGNTFMANVPITGLVGGCPGGRGAFAETLSVYAMATDGFSTLTYLNAYATPVAFALVPATT